MKNSIFLMMIFVLISCNEQKNSAEQIQSSKAQIKVATIKTGSLPNYLQFSGETMYLNKNEIVAPINGYITNVKVHEGDKVSKAKLLFEMQSPEAYIMQQTDSLKKTYGVVKITSPVSGVVSGLQVMQKNVYTDQAAELCLITASGDLKVEINLPFEYRKYAKIGQKCQIVLPDKSTVKASISKILPQMEAQNQSMKILANLQTSIFVPEQMIVKVLINQSDNKKVQILPKNCLMNDALMTQFWVMKLTNDTTAVKVPVKIGNQTHKQVEILSPKFAPQDRIISQGAYGLGDSALVEVLN